MNKTPSKTEPPVSIKIVCLLIFWLTIVIPYTPYTPYAFLVITIITGEREYYTWHTPYYGFSIIVQLLCVAGLWKMKRWAAYAYIGFIVQYDVVLLLIGEWFLVAFFSLIQAVAVAITLKNISKMS